MSLKYTEKKISNGTITGNYLHVIGNRNFILGDNCFVEGNWNTVIGYNTCFKGENNKAKYPREKNSK